MIQVRPMIHAGAFAFLFLAFLRTPEAQSIASKGSEILAKTDQVLYPVEGTYRVAMTAEFEDGKTLHWEFEGYKKGAQKQTIVMIQPPIQRNSVGIRSGDAIYWKLFKWPKPQIMSYQAVFLESPMSYGDILSTDTNRDYEVTEISEKGPKEIKLTLSPKRTGLYAKLEVFIDPENLHTNKKIYYTASGSILKIASYSNYVEEGGKLTSFRISMNHIFMKIQGTATVSGIKQETLPGFIFSPVNIGRIHAQR